ncbi:MULTISPECIES: DUF4870 domain-containing protein [Staphylococcus]|uniref:DUF4870 domain-containing protein n=1 Tax=Staphylococcus TaxID=1279 RepID=UPI000852F663|nr:MULTISPECIES: DUF4870 domain-containing protein [Staphylococcus]MBF2782338.1 DUF4870 domain-containing protein [Staphylococcus saprophyticus]MDW4255861.1 DUF4870 domain-containing protein [Staphylococcus saprophyticus]MEB8089651.1 DUF4870 domain-containing protein [Staphylococcus saprophyticus]OEK44753.1 hypothetical protein ASS91_06750 [Staphylococcus saprophyticus]QKQ04493.1 DUF4870 domain-containing protein [Staphylococcus saprophyticus]
MNLQNQSKNPQAFSDVSQNEKSMAMLLWILNIFTGFIGPLIIWLMKKDESLFINKQGRNYLNYAISYTIYIIASLILTVILIGYIPLFILTIASFVYSIIGIVTVNKGEDFVVPLTIEILK